MHSGTEESKIWDLKKFERSWRLGGYWGLVILKPDQLSASATEEAMRSAAEALRLVNPELRDTYTDNLKKWIY